MARHERAPTSCPSAPERMICAHGLSYAYRSSRHPYSAICTFWLRGSRYSGFADCNRWLGASALGFRWRERVVPGEVGEVRDVQGRERGGRRCGTRRPRCRRPGGNNPAGWLRLVARPRSPQCSWRRDHGLAGEPRRAWRGSLIRGGGTWPAGSARRWVTVPWGGRPLRSGPARSARGSGEAGSGDDCEERAELLIGVERVATELAGRSGRVGASQVRAGIGSSKGMGPLTPRIGGLAARSADPQAVGPRAGQLPG